MTQQYGTQISWVPHGGYTAIILLSNANTSVSAANGGQHQQALLIFYNISARAPIISARVGFHGRIESAHLPFERPIGARPRPSISATSRAPRWSGGRERRKSQTLPVLARYISEPDTSRAADKTGTRQRAYGAVRRPNKSTTEAHACQENATRIYKAPEAHRQVPDGNQIHDGSTSRTDKAPTALRRGPDVRTYGAVGKEGRRGTLELTEGDNVDQRY